MLFPPEDVMRTEVRIPSYSAGYSHLCARCYVHRRFKGFLPAETWFQPMRAIPLSLDATVIRLALCTRSGFSSFGDISVVPLVRAIEGTAQRLVAELRVRSRGLEDGNAIRTRRRRVERSESREETSCLFTARQSTVSAGFHHSRRRDGCFYCLG